MAHTPDKHSFVGHGGAQDIVARLSLEDDSSNLSSEAQNYAISMSESSSPQDSFLAYVYGIHGTGGYFEAFSSHLGLGEDRARVPLTSNRVTYNAISAIGAALLNQHLGWKFNSSEVVLNTFQCSPNDVLKTPSDVKYSQGNNAILFDNETYCHIPSEIWEFKANGAPVVKNWLLNRKLKPKGRKSSELDEITETKWIYKDEFVKMIADVSAVIEAKKLVMPLLQQVVEELEAQPGK
jgi:hypothetical protein